MKKHLTCNCCGFKQYDEETILNTKDEVYICGACLDSENQEFFKWLYETRKGIIEEYFGRKVEKNDSEAIEQFYFEYYDVDEKKILEKEYKGEK